MVVIILLLLFIALFIFFILKCYFDKEWTLNLFKKHSTIVFGAKGKGKDLLFQYVIKNRKKPYLSNSYYGYGYNFVTIGDICIKPNTFENFIHNDISTIQKNNTMEGKDIYISDCGVYLPSQYDFLINKYYPSLSLDYALHRHLYNANIHCNTQNLERIYKGLREQADYYIKCNKCKKFLFFFVLDITTYEKYDSALSGLIPLKNSIFNKFDKAFVKQYQALHGDIKNCKLFITKKSIKYDTRYFHEKVFGIKAS